MVVQREPGGGKRLVAFFTPRHPDRPPAAAALRAALAAELPEYMLPQAWRALDELPLDPNGKVDRKALAALPVEPEAAAGDGDGAAPRTPVEELVAGIWADTLGRPRVGVADDFFALGGHSLLATQVVSRLRDALGVELPLRRLFERPTVAALAEAVEAARAERLEHPAPPLRPAAEAGPAPASFAQERLWFLDRFGVDPALYNLPLALRLRGALDVAALAAALGEIVRRHEALRTTFAAGGGGDRGAAGGGSGGSPVQVVAAAPTSPRLPVIDLAALAPERREREARRLAAADGRRPFDLERGPLFRTALIRLDAGEHVLLAAMHHIVSDGWSVGVFDRELAALYGAFRRRRPSPLAPLPVQYGDFARWQRGWLAGAALDEQLAYWKRQLAGSPELLALPTDRPRPAVQGFRGARCPVFLPAPLTGALEALARRSGATLFMVLLAGLQALLARLSGSRDVPVGTIVANRNRLEIEALIGFFVNTLVLRCRFEDDPGFGAAVARAREAALDAFAHQDLPFAKLVAELRPERNLSHTPLFQVMLMLQNAGTTGAPLPGLEREWLRSAPGTAKFDLNLALVEVRAEVDGDGGRRPGRRAGVQPRPLRPHHRRPADRPPDGAARRRGRRSRAPAERAAAAVAGRPPSARRRVERHRRGADDGGGGRRPVPASRVRAPGGGRSRGAGGDLRRRADLLRRAEPPRQPARPPPDRGRASAPAPWWRSTSSGRRRWWWRCWRWARRVGPTCRWRPRGRRAGSTGCWRATASAT